MKQTIQVYGGKGQKDVNNMLILAEMIFTDFDDFRTVVPGWFSE